MAQPSRLNAQVPEAMASAVDRAYFGGRFEVSHIGPIAAECHGYDIASAYPYALALLPCFAHGEWIHEEKWRGDAHRPDEVSCVRYRTRPHPRACPAWGPLPHRLPDGNIVFPRVSAGGWAWDRELRPAMRLHPGVTPGEAWTWKKACDCPPPFRQKIVELFCRRLAWGKGSRGIVLKLGLNSMYGKSAQQVGSGRFRCMVRAGIVTATTRGMLLEAILAAPDPWDVLELATDSVLSRTPLRLPDQKLLGTEGAAIEKKKTPLGGWEYQFDDRDRNEWRRGVFLCQPGMRFPLGRGPNIKRVAARGLGVRVLHANRGKIVKRWGQAPREPLRITVPSMFHGAKPTVRRVLGEADAFGDRQWSYVKDPLYGRWTVPERRKFSYLPAPKRSGYLEPLWGPLGPAFPLELFTLSESPLAESCAYSGQRGALGDLLEELRELEGDQPDGAGVELV